MAAAAFPGLRIHIVINFSIQGIIQVLFCRFSIICHVQPRNSQHQYKYMLAFVRGYGTYQQND